MDQSPRVAPHRRERPGREGRGMDDRRWRTERAAPPRLEQELGAAGNPGHGRGVPRQGWVQSSQRQGGHACQRTEAVPGFVGNWCAGRWARSLGKEVGTNISRLRGDRCALEVSYRSRLPRYWYRHASASLATTSRPRRTAPNRRRSGLRLERPMASPTSRESGRTTRIHPLKCSTKRTNLDCIPEILTERAVVPALASSTIRSKGS